MAVLKSLPCQKRKPMKYQEHLKMSFMYQIYISFLWQSEEKLGVNLGIDLKLKLSKFLRYNVIVIENENS